jgi:hypothetical protein
VKNTLEQCEDFWNQYFLQKISTGVAHITKRAILLHAPWHYLSNRSEQSALAQKKDSRLTTSFF